MTSAMKQPPPALRLYDAHNHLQDERFAGRQAALLQEAKAAGVARMVVNGSCEADWPHVAALAKRFPDCVLPGFGCHPWYIGERGPHWHEHLREILQKGRATVGEIGLDRWRRDLPWEGQEEVFVAQLRLAAEFNRPASIHCLQAWGPLVDILEREPLPACGILLHSYGGSVETLERLTRRGAYFSLPGYFAHGRKDRQREVFRHVPPTGCSSKRMRPTRACRRIGSITRCAMRMARH
jgi:TatD DNase family protein